MIELLIVIAVLGILAVAVLSAINPLEQINRGRDTASKSDAEQLLGAIERYDALRGLFPWQDTAVDAADLAWVTVSEAEPTGTTCTMMENLLSDPADADCPGTDEIKSAFANRLASSTSNSLYMEYLGETGNSVYVCFNPQSVSFKKEADDRCKEGVPPDDFPVTACGSCPETSLGKNDNCVCLP